MSGKMSNKRRPGPAKALGLVGILACGVAEATQPDLVRASFEDHWVGRDASIQLQFDNAESALLGRVAVFVGHQDLTGLFFESEAGLLTYHAPQVPLPVGTHELVVFNIGDARNWQEIARIPLQVLTDGGFEQAEWRPSVDISLDMQNKESASGDVFPSPRPKYEDLNAQAGIHSTHRRGELLAESRFQLTGTSNQDSALRAGELGADAPKFDLADYSAGVELGDTRFTIGHVYYGAHPLLLSGIGHRGLLVEHRFSDRVDFSVTSQSGRRIVGYNRFLGFTRGRDRINGATLGVDLLPMTGTASLRAEISYVTAKIEAESGFGFGTVPVTEKSDGWGIRLIGSGFDDRLRGQVQFARSKYTNPTKGSPEFMGEAIVDVVATTNNARSVGVEYDLIRGARWSDTRSFDLSISVDHERIDPQYRTLGAFPGADIDRNRFAFSALLGPIAVSGSHAEQRDNLDGLRTVLATRTRATDVSMDAPLAALLGRDDAVSPWWPNVNVNLQRVHQFATNTPPPALSEFDSPSHLPDQMNESQNLGLTWYVDRWNFGYQAFRSHQDNRQEGRNDADFTNVDHRLDAGVQVSPALRLAGNLGITHARDHERRRTERTPAYGASAEWRVTDRVALNGQYNGSRTRDNVRLSRASSDSLSAQVSARLGGKGGRSPAQVFVRYSRQDNSLADKEFDFETAGRRWAIQSGLNVSF